MPDGSKGDRTAERMTPRRRGSYGIDAPFAPALLAFMAALEVALAVISGSVRPLLAALFILAVLGFYLYATLRGKFVVWAELLDQLSLRGDERILDLGCGRGAVLLMAAQHLTTGRAVGVDLWRSVDQSGNSVEATRRNAIAEGVADRVELHTADMTALPLEDDSFDVVYSHGVLHHTPDTGKEIATLECGSGHWNSPIVVDGRIALPEGDSNRHSESGVLNIWRLP